MYEEREDTDPGTLTAGGPFRAWRETTRFFGRHRRLFVPLGVLALVALGVHAAADRFDDWAFRVLDAADRGVEWAYGLLADAVLTRPEAKKTAFASLFDLAAKEQAARWSALAVELLLDLRVGLGALGAFDEDPLGYVVPGSKLHHRLAAAVGRPLHHLKQAGRRTAGYLRHLSIEKIYLPLSVALAVLAGTLALFVALDNAFFALGRRLPAHWDAVRWLSPWPAAVAAAIVLWRLGVAAVIGAFARCDRVMRKDLDAGEGVLARTLRGAVGAVLVLPILLAGLWTGTPLGGWAAQILHRPGP